MRWLHFPIRILRIFWVSLSETWWEQVCTCIHSIGIVWRHGFAHGEVVPLSTHDGGLPPPSKNSVNTTQLGAESQILSWLEQILHLILAVRPRKYDQLRLISEDNESLTDWTARLTCVFEKRVQQGLNLRVRTHLISSQAPWPLGYERGHDYSSFDAPVTSIKETDTTFRSQNKPKMTKWFLRMIIFFPIAIIGFNSSLS